MDASKIKAIIAAILATFAALYLGISAATAQLETIAWVMGMGTLSVCLLLGRRIWLLLPFMAALQLTLMIPGQPTTLILAQLLILSFSVLMLLSRKLPFYFVFTELEFLALLLILCVFQVYARNPVGVNILGGDSVGGRPYILFGITTLTGLLLCGLRVPPKELYLAMKLSIAGGLLNFVIGLIGWLNPAFGVWFGAASKIITEEIGVTAPEMAGRINFIVFVPITLANWVSSCSNPLTAIFKPRWIPLIFLSFAFAAASGYRNVIGAVGLTYLVGVFYHGRFVSVLIAGIMGAATLALLAIVNLIMPLPAKAQRSLSFLPGTWEQRYVLESKNSNDWRTEIWEEVLLTDRWIENKWIGDGLGFTAREFAAQQAMSERKNYTVGISGFDAHRENILANGDYHSGPVSAVRTVGYVGLLLMALIQIRLAMHAHRLIIRCKGTEWFPVALFFGIPIVWMPIFFWLIFGGFAIDGPAILMAIGMLRLMQNNIPLASSAPNRQLIPHTLNINKHVMTEQSRQLGFKSSGIVSEQVPKSR